jgi:hypothetical protein
MPYKQPALDPAPALNSPWSGPSPDPNLIIFETDTLLSRDKCDNVSPNLALFVIRNPRAEVDVDEELP